MVTITALTSYADHILLQIPTITKRFIVVDDSQLVKELGDVSADDGLVLVGLIPSHKIDGSSADDAKPTDTSVWMVLTKVVRADGQAAFLLSMERCQTAIKELVKLMLTDRSPVDNACGLMRMLQVSSLTIDPVWSLNGCDGYEINYQLKSNLWQ